ncbi:hypothetical protein M2266_003939 [Streptomyces sp. SPB162]|nr:hypothetical protein [Streptomyces sp. SPB162]
MRASVSCRSSSAPARGRPDGQRSLRARGGLRDRDGVVRVPAVRHRPVGVRSQPVQGGEQPGEPGGVLVLVGQGRGEPAELGTQRVGPAGVGERAVRVQGRRDPAGGPAQQQACGGALVVGLGALAEGPQEGGRLLVQVAGDHLPGAQRAEGGRPCRLLVEDDGRWAGLGVRGVTVSLGHAGASGRR